MIFLEFSSKSSSEYQTMIVPFFIELSVNFDFLKKKESEQ